MYFQTKKDKEKEISMKDSNFKLRWEQMQEIDLQKIDHIGNKIHTQLPERPEVFKEKFLLFPAGCKKLIYETNIIGYGISHPWLLNSIPKLDSFLVSLPRNPECLFIHDVVVLPNYRGHNTSSDYVECMRRIASSLGLHALSLVSVYGTTSLWSRYGFEEIFIPDLHEKLISYGESARYMVSKYDN